MKRPFKKGDFVKLVYDYKSYEESVYIGKITKIDGYYESGDKKNLNLILNPYVHFYRDTNHKIRGFDKRNDDGRFYLYDVIEKVLGIEEGFFVEII